jgi:hypothetical protein
MLNKVGPEVVGNSALQCCSERGHQNHLEDWSKQNSQGCVCGSVVNIRHSMCEALGSIPCNTKMKHQLYAGKEEKTEQGCEKLIIW